MELDAHLWLKARHRLGESLIWHQAREEYIWVDLLDPMLCQLRPDETAPRIRRLDLPPPIGSLAATTDPRLVILAHRGGLSVLDLETLAMTPYCDPEGGRDAIIYNDIKVDPWGRLWVGTSHAREAEPRGALWCVQSHSRWAMADAGFAISNGPAFSADGRTMYFNDSAGRQTLTYDIGPDDLLARNRRVLVAHAPEDGLPDGIVVDAAGDLWTAQWAGRLVLRFGRDGALKDRIKVPAVNVTTLCFGGRALDQMRIITATDGVSAADLEALPLTGSLFTASPRNTNGVVTGRAEPLFSL